MSIKRFFQKFFKKEKVPIFIGNNKGTLLKNRKALITGGGSGIGFEIAKAFEREGCKVFLAGRNEEKLKRAVGLLNDAEYILLDLAHISSFRDAITEFFSINKIDILVNCAGAHHTEKFLEVSEKEYDSIFDTNVKGTYFLSQEIAVLMIKDSIKGNILNISSTSGIRPAWGPYQMSKWAINGMTLGLADKLIKHGIVVNAIAPGQTATEMLHVDKTGDLNNDSALCGRYILPEEIAETAVFLVSGLGRMIVGDTVYVSGGSGIVDSRK